MTGGIYSSKSNATDILNLSDGTWRSGSDFPSEREFYYGSSVQYKNSFLAVGGFNFEDEDRDEVWYFNPDFDVWERQNVSLSRPRHAMAAMFISDDVCSEEYL